MNRTEYNEINAVNFSALKNYLRSPAHFLHQFQTPSTDEEATKAMILGKAIHKIVLEEKSFNDTYVVLDESQRPVPDKDYKTKLNSDWKTFTINMYKRSGKTVVTQQEYDNLFGVASSVKENKSARNLLKDCKNEEVIEWTDEVTGVKCKGIVDFHSVEKRMVGDLKSMEDASPGAFSVYMAKWMTHVQLCFYADGLEAIHGVPFNTAFVIAVEKTAPFVSQTYFVDERAIEAGRVVYRSLLSLHKKCVETKRWEGYGSMYSNINGVIVSDIPAWVYGKIEANEVFQTN